MKFPLPLLRFAAGFEAALALLLLRSGEISISKLAIPSSRFFVFIAGHRIYVDFVQSTKEYAALAPADGEYSEDHASAASKTVADMKAGWFDEVEVEKKFEDE